MKRFPPLIAALFAVLPLEAQRPLYLVNGEPRDEIASIPARDIECIEELPADEETIARYGERAADGVLLITLRYDTPARFEADTTLGAYIARRVRWDDDEPAARVVVRYRITDHRINYTIYNLAAFMDGDIQDCIDHLIVAENAERLKESDPFR